MTAKVEKQKPLRIKHLFINISFCIYNAMKQKITAMTSLTYLIISLIIV